MLTPEQLTELETTHKRIARLRGGSGAWEVVFRKPTRAEFKRFRTMASNPNQRAEAQEVLARTCVVHPSREAFDALLEDYPAICDSEEATSVFKRLMSDAVEDDGK